MPESLRLFIAIPVPMEIRTALREARRELIGALPRSEVRWTGLESMHLTLRFLGDVPTSKVSSLADQFASSVANFGSVPLICERLGCFPSLRLPRVLWGWVHDEHERLNRLQQRVTEATQGFTQQPAETQAFTGHITIARIKKLERREGAGLATVLHQFAGRRFGQWTADRLELIESTLLPSGSRYAVRAEAPLTASA